MKKLLILGLCALTSTAVLADDALFKKLDTDGDGLISISESVADADVSKAFVDLDTNVDGYLSAEEFADF